MLGAATRAAGKRVAGGLGAFVAGEAGALPTLPTIEFAGTGTDTITLSVPGDVQAAILACGTNDGNHTGYSGQGTLEFDRRDNASFCDMSFYVVSGVAGATRTFSANTGGQDRFCALFYLRGAKSVVPVLSGADAYSADLTLTLPENSTLFTGQGYRGTSPPNMFILDELHSRTTGTNFYRFGSLPVYPPFAGSRSVVEQYQAGYPKKAMVFQ